MSLLKKFSKWFHQLDEDGNSEFATASKWYKRTGGKITLTPDLTVDPPDLTGWQRSPIRTDRALVKNPKWKGCK